MEFSSSGALPTKAHRARVLALATAILLEQAGERIGLADRRTPPRSGAAQLTRIATALMADGGGDDYGVPSAAELATGSRVLLVSDFFGEPDQVEAMVLAAADRGISGAMLQILDPAEEAFPYAGRAIFESMAGFVQHETKEEIGRAHV